MYKFVKKDDQNYVIENNWLKFIKVGEIILSELYTEIKLSSTSMSVFDQVDLFKEIVEKFEEVKNKQVRFTNLKAEEITYGDDYCIGDLC